MNMENLNVLHYILMAVGAVGGLAVIRKIVIPFIGKVFGWMSGNK